MKGIILSVFIMMFALCASAQTTGFFIKSNSKGLYIDHKVTAKQNFYSIGRLFNVHPKHLASFNSLDMSKGLSIGQVIKIPLTDTNFNQKSEIGIPVYYVTSNSEGLYRVSTSNNNVLMEKLAKWNHLTNETITAGSKLIVGFLKVNETETAPIAKSQVEPVKKEQENNKEIAKTEPLNVPDTKKQDTKKEMEAVKNTQTAQTKETPKKEEPKKEDIIPAKAETKPQNSKQGYFKLSFDQQIKQQPITKEQTLTCGIFKTASGWSDDKYYLLMDGGEPGTIVKITNPANNRLIYAKLLGEMSGLKPGQGVNIRISNAAASALDITETDKFIVKLNY